MTVHLVSDAHLPGHYHHLTARAKAPLVAVLSLASMALAGYDFSLLLELLRLLRDLNTVAPGGGVSLLRVLFGSGLPILAGVGWIAAVVLIVYAYSRYGVRSRWLKQSVNDLPPMAMLAAGAGYRTLFSRFLLVTSLELFLAAAVRAGELALWGLNGTWRGESAAAAAVPAALGVAAAVARGLIVRGHHVTFVARLRRTGRAAREGR